MIENNQILELKDLTSNEVKDYIRKKLTVDKFKHRFEMSGYENKTGETTIGNLNIINKFASLGIYDYTHYLYLDFYKGTPTLYLKYWGSDKNEEFEFSGFTTSEIIYEIFKLTIFSDKVKRRR